MSYTFWIDRNQDNNNCYLTIQQQISKDQVVKIFDRIYCKSGSNKYSHHSWISSKSPIPFNKPYTNKFGEKITGTFQNKLYLHLKPVGKKGTAEQDPKHIGRAWPISSSTVDTRHIYDESKRYQRLDIQIHDENNNPGSLGCPVIQDNEDYIAVDNFLYKLKEEGLLYIPGYVI